MKVRENMFDGAWDFRGGTGYLDNDEDCNVKNRSMVEFPRLWGSCCRIWIPRMFFQSILRYSDGKATISCRILIF